MIQTILSGTGAQIRVGQNGRIWVGGDSDAIERVREVLRMIDEEGHRRGLTERVDSYLRSTASPGEDGRAVPPTGSGVPAHEPVPLAPRDPGDAEVEDDLASDPSPDAEID